MSFKQDELRLYELAVRAERLLRNETGEWAATRQAQLREMKCKLQSHKFRVAVVGEFKRGKSSFINVLLGKHVLPEDMLPTTATLNRITYGEKPAAYIRFKDAGKDSIRIPVEDISDYVTKWTSSSAERAKEIQEVIVEYPTLFCFNDVDLIDTPGMNDEDDLNATTIRCLEDVDLAIVAINAQYPFSETEARFVLKLLESSQICQIIFVVTYMDCIRKREQAKILDYIANRISENVHEELLRYYSPQDDIFRKYHRMFAPVKIFGVSSLLGMEALEINDMELYKESGFQQLSQELPDIILRSRSVNLIENMADGLHTILAGIQEEQAKTLFNEQQRSILAAEATDTIGTFSVKLPGLAAEVFQTHPGWDELLSLKDGIVEQLLSGLQHLYSLDPASVHSVMVPIIQKEFQRVNHSAEKIGGQIAADVYRRISDEITLPLKAGLEEKFSVMPPAIPERRKILLSLSEDLMQIPPNAFRTVHKKTESCFFWSSSPIHAVINTPEGFSVMISFREIAAKSLEKCVQKMKQDIGSEITAFVKTTQSGLADLMESMLALLEHAAVAADGDSDIQELQQSCENLRNGLSGATEE